MRSSDNRSKIVRIRNAVQKNNKRVLMSVLGSLKDFEYTDKLSQISQPTLICSGTRDICTPVVAASLYEHIPGSQWHLFRQARHTCFVDAHEEYCKVLTRWLQENTL